MAPKRRAATRQASAQQATLSFHGRTNKITKQRLSDDAKSSKKNPDALDSAIKDESQVEVKSALKEPTTAQKGIRQQAIEEAAPDPIEQPADDKTSDVLGGRAKSDNQGAVGGTGAGWIADEDKQARKISDTQIKKYWRTKEEQRIVPRVHQDDLTVYEKVLREWDMSGQYGPCIGIARLKRWKRANVLGLHPPMEVLAVLLKQMDQGDVKSQRAHVDELMSSRFVET
ncbi:hypothetical protein AMS68_005234 [Peltaster fructicola]|uniref:DNA polymerase delta subunit 4 n=1 Tax=Peltaster fructicola TaxID=286661 RepID=A0A6H0XY65_9PEZI|nr:hypothetical protein AMS68_005234 [Peltaster fructicola]